MVIEIASSRVDRWLLSWVLLSIPKGSADLWATASSADLQFRHHFLLCLYVSVLMRWCVGELVGFAGLWVFVLRVFVSLFFVCVSACLRACVFLCACVACSSVVGFLGLCICVLVC